MPALLLRGICLCSLLHSLPNLLPELHSFGLHNLRHRLPLVQHLLKLFLRRGQPVLHQHHKLPQHVLALLSVILPELQFFGDLHRVLHRVLHRPGDPVVPLDDLWGRPGLWLIVMRRRGGVWGLCGLQDPIWLRCLLQLLPGGFLRAVFQLQCGAAVDYCEHCPLRHLNPDLLAYRFRRLPLFDGLLEHRDSALRIRPKPQLLLPLLQNPAANIQLLLQLLTKKHHFLLSVQQRQPSPPRYRSACPRGGR